MLCLRKRKMLLASALSEKMWEKQSCKSLSRCRRRQGLLQVQNRSSLQPKRGPCRNRVSSCSPGVPCRADVHMQLWRSPQCTSGWDVKEEQPIVSRSNSSPRPQRGSSGGAGGQEGAAVCGDICWRNLSLKGGSCGTEPYWSCAWRAAACEKATQDHFGKDSILWERQME